MRLRRIDYFLARLAHTTLPMHRLLGNVETEHFRDKLRSIVLEHPVFLTGLARSGTTILLQELCQTNLFATHQYRDFPFLMTPCVWNWFLDRFTGRQAPVERPHQDRIRISGETPEAFEEPIWQFFFPEAHAQHAIHRIGADEDNPEFERFFREHICKIMLVRHRVRYLSKGNYNLARLEYIAKMFPDARFVIPVRHPVTHVHSLVRQHQLFTEYSQKDPRVSRYLAMVGHYEFGPQRVPLRLSSEDADLTAQAWRRGDEHAGYAIQWAQVYRLIASLLRPGHRLAERICVVRYEDFCADPCNTLATILKHARVPDGEILSGRSFGHISLSTGKSLSANLLETIWGETNQVAGLFGYQTADPAHRGQIPKADTAQVARTEAGLTCHSPC